MIKVAKTDVWSNWITLSARFVRRAMQDCEWIRAVIRREFTRDEWSTLIAILGTTIR
jgi:hypothetical protein